MQQIRQFSSCRLDRRDFTLPAFAALAMLVAGPAAAAFVDPFDRFDGVASEGPKAPGSTLQDALRAKRLPGSAHPNVRSVTHQTATFRHYTGQEL